MTASKGRLYGLGVGPGDPELMTVKAWRILSTVPAIAYLAANGGESTARAIARPFIPEDVVEIAIDMPMRTEREPAQQAYDKGCAAIREQLDQGRDVAVLCEGDPFFYGSFIHIFARLSADYDTTVVPGVSSITAAAARLGRPLAARSDVLKIVPATLAAERMRQELSTAETAAIIKVGRHLAKVRDVLAVTGLMQAAVAIEKVTQSDERLFKLADFPGGSVSYFTTILVARSRDEQP